ncbi:glycosyltransferase family 1 protein [bacterium]|nr:MAG: glycosyltransferase family 1 protein [bacterium]
MRIGIDVRALMEGKTTGVEAYITNLLHALFELDKSNQYLLFANSFTNIEKFLPKFGYPNVQYRIFRKPNKFFNLSQKFFSTPKIDKLLGGVDLFFSPHWRYAALSPEVPLIVTFHDLSFKFLPEYFTFWQRIWHRFMDYEYAAKRADRIIAVSESTKKDIIDVFGVADEKIRVIYSGINNASVIARSVLDSSLRGSASDRSNPNDNEIASSRFESGLAMTGNKKDARNDIALNLPPKYFLSLGTFEPRKNAQGVLAAYKEYREKSKIKLPLVLAGSSGWKIKKELPNDENIIVIENFPENAKSALLQNSFALLFVSFYEGFGFPVLEAASAGIPVVAAYGTSIAEIGKDFALFANPLRPSEIAQAMLALENDSDYYNALKQRGIAASKNFAWDKTAGQVLKLFNEIVK